MVNQVEKSFTWADQRLIGDKMTQSQTQTTIYLLHDLTQIKLITTAADEHVGLHAYVTDFWQATICITQKWE